VGLPAFHRSHGLASPLPLDLALLLTRSAPGPPRERARRPVRALPGVRSQGIQVSTRGRNVQHAGDDDAAVVDRLLRKLHASNPAPGAATLTNAASHGGFRSSGLDASPGPGANLPAPGPTPRDLGQVGVWARVGLGVVAAVAVTQWPYARTCGVGLLGYLLAVTTVLVTGFWGAGVSWRGRLASAHVIALCTILWGLALAAHEILPRAGYITSSASWWCAPSRGAIHPPAPAGSDSALRPPV
jgi:hypothetical protein